MLGSAAALWRMETSSLASRTMVGCLLFWSRRGWRSMLPDVRCSITFKLSNGRTSTRFLCLGCLDDSLSVLSSSSAAAPKKLSTWLDS